MALGELLGLRGPLLPHLKLETRLPGLLLGLNMLVQELLKTNRVCLHKGALESVRCADRSGEGADG